MTASAAPSIYAVLPFVAMLLAIAVGPLSAPHWWESNANKLLVAVALAVPVLIMYLVREPAAVLHTVEDYVSFVLLLSALYAIAGGIRLTGDLQATPLINATFLGLGSILASIIGTTGASMVLIRPLLQTNRERRRVRHTVIFFIFLVSNIGGMLTPLGDPPLFLGYLQGVPFAWTLRLWPHWLFMTGALLTLYVAWDTRQYRQEPAAARRRDTVDIEPLRLRGALNALPLALVVVAVAFLRAPWREIVIVACAAVSLWRTPVSIRRDNGVTAAPMVEVAVLFLGIFITMIPALELLRAHGGELSVREPWQFFWATGVLSTFLDNAPTYVTFLALAQGLHITPEVVGVTHQVLAAISVAAVAMGANSYIGNAPNFMVKAIVEEAKIPMPSFFGYMLYSGAILVPLFVAATLIFFR